MDTAIPTPEQRTIVELYRWIRDFDRNPCKIGDYLSPELVACAEAALERCDESVSG